MAPWVWIGEENHERRRTPPFLYKYYSPSGIQKTIAGNCLKWEFPCDENDPFEAAGRGWDLSAINKEIESDRQKGKTLFDVADADAIFDLEKSKKLISHAAAFMSFAERGDNVLMWSHYARNHTGACLVFDTSILSKGVGSFSPANYAKELCAERKRVPLPRNEKGDADPEYAERVIDFLSFKANEWAYEEEWRLIVPPMADVIEPVSGEGGFVFVTRIPIGAVKTLIFGYNTPLPTRLAWAKQIRQHHPACAFAEITLDRGKFQLSIDPIGIDHIGGEEH